MFGWRIHFFIFSVIGHTYSFLPVPGEWQKYRERCVELYKDEKDADKLIDAAIQKGLVNRFAECATENGHINAKKAYFIFMILRLLVAGAFFAMIAYAVYFVEGLSSKAVYQVEIVNPVTLKGTTNVQPQTTTTTTTTTVPASSRRPTP